MKLTHFIFALILAFFATDALGQNAKVVSTYNYLKYYKRDNSDKDALRKGVDAIGQAIEHDRTKENGKTWLYRGEVYFLIAADTALRGEYETPAITAFESFKKSIEVDDRGFRKEDQSFNFLLKTWRLLFNFGVNEFKQKNFQRAYDYFTASVKCKNFLEEHGKGEKLDAKTAILNAAIAAQNMQQYDKALDQYQQLIEMGDAEPSVYQSVSRIHKTQGDTTKALNWLEKGREQHPKDLALIIDELNIYLASDNEEEAIGKLENAVALDSTNPQLHYALGVAYDEKGMFDRAKTAYKKAISKDTTYYNAYRNLGALFYNQAIEMNKEMNNLGLDEEKKYEKMKKERNDLYANALPYLEKAKDLKPDDIKTLQALKEIYAKTGEYEKSKEVKQQIQKAQGG